MNIIELEGNNIMNILARSVLEMYRLTLMQMTLPAII